MRKLTEQDFWLRTKLNITTNCLEWIGSKDEHGYGQFGYAGKGRRSHRMAWVFKNGSIPENLQVLHKCDNSCCVNVEHLFLGTIKQNMEDRKQKGRNANFNGIKNPNNKKSEHEIKSLRLLFALGFSRRKLSILFSLDYSTVKYIIRKKLWKLLPDFSILEAAEAYQQLKQKVIV